MIKAIQTRYKGYHFRSRLEARWAVFFDALGIKYKYEEYGFEKEGYKWLPDFYLPDSATWVEVKGGKPNRQDVEKMARILDHGSPLPFFDWSGEDKGMMKESEIELLQSMGGERQYWYQQIRRGVLLLGNIPEVDFGVTVHPIIRHKKVLVRDFTHFVGKSGDCSPHILDKGALSMFRLFSNHSVYNDETLDGMDYSETFFVPDTFYAPSIRAFPDVCEAYKKARSARFEHGETPNAY